MASAFGTIIVIKLDDKYLGKNGVVDELQDAMLLDFIYSGRFTEGRDIAEKYGVDTSKFKEIGKYGITPPYTEEHTNQRYSSGCYAGLPYQMVRNLADANITIREYYDSLFKTNDNTKKDEENENEL